MLFFLFVCGIVENLLGLEINLGSQDVVVEEIVMKEGIFVGLVDSYMIVVIIDGKEILI